MGLARNAGLQKKRRIGDEVELKVSAVRFGKVQEKSDCILSVKRQGRNVGGDTGSA